MLNNKKLNLVLTKLYIRGTRKLNISVFIKQSYFAASKNIRLNSTKYFIMKIPNKQGIQQNAFNHSSNTDFKDFMNLYKKCTAKQYPFLVVDATLASDNPSRFRKKEYKNQSWKLMIRFEMKNYKMTLRGKQQNYQHYHHAKLINMNTLQVRNIVF